MESSFTESFMWLAVLGLALGCAYCIMSPAINNMALRITLAKKRGEDESTLRQRKTLMQLVWFALCGVAVFAFVRIVVLTQGIVGS